MTRTTAISASFLLLALFAALAPAQREGRRGPDPRAMEARQAYLEQLDEGLAAIDSKLDAESLTEFKAIARSVVRRLDRRTLERLGAAPLAEQVKEIVAIHRREREEEARRFIDRQSPEIRAELERLDPKQRDARIFALKAAGALERAISMASGHELVDEEEVQRLRTLGPKQQLDEAFRLQRVIFMHVHGATLNQEERGRLEQLDGRGFWRDPVVRRFQLRGRISRGDITRLREVEESDRKAILEALKKGAALDEFVARGVVDAETAQRWSALDERERDRLVRVLDRLHFSRREREYLPWDLVRRLPDEARGQFMRLPPEERRAFLEENLAEEDRLIFRSRVEAMARLKPLLDGLESGQKGMLFGVMPEVARERLLSFLPEESDRIDAIVSDLAAAGFFTDCVPLRRSQLRELSAEEQANLAAMTPEQRADFVFRRFAEDFDADARRRLERAGQSVPADWSNWSGARKVAHLNRVGQRLRGDRFGGWRGRRGHEDRDDEADEKGDDLDRDERSDRHRRRGRHGRNAENGPPPGEKF